MIKSSRLTFTYTGQSVIQFPDLACGSNEHLLILGPSGTGKTTLLHLLGGLISPSSGEIFIGSTPVHSLRGHALDSFRGKNIGLIFQRPHFIRSLTAMENLELTQSLSGSKPDKNHALALLERLSIASKAHVKADTMSIGEQQRLAIARALMNHPAVILADEPSSALDDVHCLQMIELLLQVATEQNSNLIVVTHDSRIKDMIAKRIHLS